MTKPNISLTQMVLISARRMLHDPDAWRKRSDVFVSVSRLEALVSSDELPVVREEAASLIERLYKTLKKPEGAY